MRIKDGFVLRKVAGQAMVIATGEASENFHGMIRLNETGEAVWQGLLEGRPESEIIQTLADDFGIAADGAARDVRELLAQMEKEGFLEP